MTKTSDYGKQLGVSSSSGGSNRKIHFLNDVKFWHSWEGFFSEYFTNPETNTREYRVVAGPTISTGHSRCCYILSGTNSIVWQSTETPPPEGYEQNYTLSGEEWNFRQPWNTYTNRVLRYPPWKGISPRYLFEYMSYSGSEPLLKLPLLSTVEYEENMELIDTRINNYYNLANTRIMLMAGNGIRLEAVLNDFLNAVSGLGEAEQDEAMERLCECTRIINQKYVGYRSFEKKKRLKNEGENIGLSNEELSEEEKLAQTEELFRKAPNRYSVEKVSGFMDIQMDGREKISIKEKQVRTKEEALMYTAAMLYAGNREFPYQIQITDEEVAKEIADMSNVVISRK